MVISKHISFKNINDIPPPPPELRDVGIHHI